MQSSTAQQIGGATPAIRLSTQCKRLADRLKGRSLSVRHLQEELQGSNFALALLLFAAPFCVPLDIPGLSMPFGGSIVLIGLRYAAGLNLWLPSWVRKREIPAGHGQRLLSLLYEIMRKFERITRPRLETICTGRTSRLVFGSTVALCGFVLCLPYRFYFPIRFPHGASLC
jgi:hypothetical protein